MDTVLHELKLLTYVRLILTAGASTSSRPFYTCVAQGPAEAFNAVFGAARKFGTVKRCTTLATIPLSLHAIAELDAALSFLYPADVCDWQWPLPFGVYAHDVLGIDCGHPRIVRSVVAHICAAAAIQLAATSSRMFPDSPDFA